MKISPLLTIFKSLKKLIIYTTDAYGMDEYRFVDSLFFIDVCSCIPLFDSHKTFKQIQIRAFRTDYDVQSWVCSLFYFLRKKQLNQNKFKITLANEYREDILFIDII